MDRISKEHRSWNMSRIRSRNTAPEVAVRSALHRMGYRFRLKEYGLPGKPDVVLSRYRTAVFVHGCFWHRHKGCRFSYTPRSRQSFWLAKFRNNVARDRRAVEELRGLDWRVIVIWECQTREHKHLTNRLEHLLARPQSRLS